MAYRSIPIPLLRGAKGGERYKTGGNTSIEVGERVQR